METRSSKRAHADVDKDPELSELQRAVKRLNTGGVRGTSSGNGLTAGFVGSSGGVGGVGIAPPMYQVPEDEHERVDGIDEDESFGRSMHYTEINALLNSLHFARVRRRESMAGPTAPLENPAHHQPNDHQHRHQ
jgi:hypothetical protein